MPPSEHGERVASLEANVTTIGSTLKEHLRDCADARKETNDRFQRLERIVWTATGAAMVISFLLRLLVR